MKYECKKCKELIEDKDIIMLQDGSGFGGDWLDPVCEKCYKEIKEIEERQERARERDRQVKKEEQEKSFWKRLRLICLIKKGD